MEPAADPVKPEDLAATIYHALGIDYTQSIASPEGVRITLARGGSHIRKAICLEPSFDAEISHNLDPFRSRIRPEAPFSGLLA